MTKIPGSRRRLTARFSVVALLVVINLASLPLVDQGTGYFRPPEAQWRLSNMAETADLLPLSQKLGNVERTHNLFLELNAVAENATIHMLSRTTRFDVGQRMRGRLNGLVRPDPLIIHAHVDNGTERAVLETVAGDEHLIRQGIIWELPRDKDKGKPGFAWRIHLATDHAEEMVMFVTNDGHETWHFVDVALLSDQLQDQIQQC